MADLARLDDHAAAVLATGMAPALAVALTDRERTLEARTYGAAAPGALWAIGSIGKSVTAVLALQLAEEGGSTCTRRSRSSSTGSTSRVPAGRSRCTTCSPTRPA